MKICVYSASSGQVDSSYVEAAGELGRLMAMRGHELINGAGRTGLMGAVTDSMMACGGHTIGVIPQFMVDRGWQHTGMSELVVTADMHSRKETMARLSDACIALPGGVGTLEELLEIITWKQLGLFLNPIVILNVNGYFDPLLALLERAVEERFMRAEHARLWAVAETPAEAIRLVRSEPRWDASIRSRAAI